MDKSQPQNDVTDEQAKIIRSMIEHENNLQNYRLTWFMTIQGLLFAALGFAWDKDDATGLVSVFCVLGIVVSLISWSSLQLSGTAYRELLKWWDEHKQNFDGPPVMCGTVRSSWVLWILRPWRALPWIFALSWIAVFVFNWERA